MLELTLTSTLTPVKIGIFYAGSLNVNGVESNTITRLSSNGVLLSPETNLGRARRGPAGVGY